MNVLLKSRFWFQFQLFRDFALSRVVPALFKVAFSRDSEAVGKVLGRPWAGSQLGAEDGGGTLDRREGRSRSLLIGGHGCV